MSLVGFHRALIAVAVVFCLGYGTWELVGAARPGGGGSRIVGGVFLLLAVGLAWYLLRLNRILGYAADDDGG